MTDHRQLESLEAKAPNILYTVAEYRANAVAREVLLVDLPGLGLTLVDVVPGRAGDQHIVAVRLRNLIEAGDIAGAHVAASRELGRPAVPTAEPPTPEQLRFLQDQARQLGARTFVAPATKAEASKWIRRSCPSRHEPWDPVRAAREEWEAAYARPLELA